MTKLSPNNMKTAALIKNLCNRAKIFFEKELKEVALSDEDFERIKIHILISASDDDESCSAKFEALSGAAKVIANSITSFGISYSNSIQDALVDLSNRLEVEENKVRATKMQKAEVAIQFPQVRDWVLLYIKQCVQAAGGKPTDLWDNPMPDVSREVNGKGVMTWLNSPKHLYNTDGAIALMNAVLNRLDNT